TPAVRASSSTWSLILLRGMCTIAGTCLYLPTFLHKRAGKSSPALAAFSAGAVGRWSLSSLCAAGVPDLESRIPYRGRQRQGTPVQVSGCHFGGVPWKCGEDRRFGSFFSRPSLPAPRRSSAGDCFRFAPRTKHAHSRDASPHVKRSKDKAAINRRT